jgi:cbb3-type cytochrome oxidase subunit 1
MRPLPFILFLAAAICAVIGMAWGIQMSASGNHAMSPAHAHLNLLGWVSLALFGTFYQLVPAAGESLLARIQAGVAVVGVVLIVPGIVMALTQAGETLAKLGSVVTILSMLLFVIVLLTRGRA